MKALTLLIGSLLCCNILFSQKTIDVAERSIKVDALKTEECYFGFAAGDQIVFNFSEADKKALKEIEILAYPYNSKFAAFETAEVENKTLPVITTGVYRFRFYNDAQSSRECKIKIQRIPASEETEAFNTHVVWENQYDTAYYTVQEQYVVKKEYVAQQVMPLTTSYVEGSNALFPEAKSRLVFPIQLPDNTVEWYYQVAVLRDQNEAVNKFSLAGELTRLMEQKGALKFDLDLLPQPAGEAYCDIYVLDQPNAIRFEAGNDFTYSLIGSNEHIQSGISKVYGGSSTPLYIGINNADTEKGINIVLECVAIVAKEEKGVRDVKQMSVTSKIVPVLNRNDVGWVH